MKRKWLLIGSVLASVLLAGVAVGGVVMAQTPSSGGSGPNSQASANQPGAGARAAFDNFLNGLAQNLGIDRSTLDNAMKTTAKQQIDQAVSAGRLTQDQANRIEQNIDNGQFPLGLGAGFRGRGPGGPGRGAMAACGSSVQQAITSTLGVSASDLKQAHQNGQSLSDIAQAHGKTVQDLRTAVSTAMKSCLDQQVQAGNLTADQEQNILQRIQNRANLPVGGHGSGNRGRQSSGTGQ